MWEHIQLVAFNAMVKKRQKTDGVDRISELPLPIIHHIMSFLCPKQLAKTSVLSKRWNYLRTSFPILDFDQTYFVGSEREVDSETDEEIYDEAFFDGIVDFVKYVNGSLLRFCELKFRMQKFRIFISLIGLKGFSSILDGWIWLAVQNGVETLDIDIETDRDTIYDLPQTIFSAKSVTTLKIAGCKLEQTSGNISFYFLKSLTLDKVQLNEQMIQKLTSECPLLEKLNFYSCWGMKCLCISNLPKLKIMHIHVSYEDELERLKISIPSLEEFRLVFEDPRVNSCVIDVDECPLANDLELMGDIFRDREFHDFISKFPVLKKLSVEWCRYLEKITISSKRLKKLRISHCANLKVLDVDTPNLSFFTFMFNQIPVSSINAPCPWRVVLDHGDVDARWYLNMKEFLRPSNKICDLTLYAEPSKVCLQNPYNFLSAFHLLQFFFNILTCFCLFICLFVIIKNTFGFDDFWKIAPALCCEVEHMTLHARRLPSNYGSLLDRALWICYPKYLTIESGGRNQKKFIKVCSSYHKS